MSTANHTVCCPVSGHLVCNCLNFLFMRWNVLIFLQETVQLLTFKMYGDRLPTSSTKEIMPFFAKLVSCPVSGQRVQFPAIKRKQKFHSICSTKRTSKAILMWLPTVLYGSLDGLGRQATKLRCIRVCMDFCNFCKAPIQTIFCWILLTLAG